MTKATRRSSFEAEYREYVKTTPAWTLMDDLVHCRKVMRWLPGSASFVCVGFLIVVPVSAWLVVLLDIFKGALPETYLPHLLAFGALSVVSHSSFMFCMSMGFVWGQKYLVRYLWGLQLLSLIFLVVAIYVKVSSFVIGFAVIGLVVAAFMSSLARGTMFTVYAELMRVKRIYMQDRREYLAELATQRRSSRKKAKK